MAAVHRELAEKQSLSFSMTFPPTKVELTTASLEGSFIFEFSAPDTRSNFEQAFEDAKKKLGTALSAAPCDPTTAAKSIAQSSLYIGSNHRALPCVWGKSVFPVIDSSLVSCFHEGLAQDWWKFIPWDCRIPISLFCVGLETTCVRQWFLFRDLRGLLKRAVQIEFLFNHIAYCWMYLHLFSPFLSNEQRSLGPRVSEGYSHHENKKRNAGSYQGLPKHWALMLILCCF